VINGTWAKEDRLSELKTALASVERKIQLSITPEATEEPREQSENQPLASNDIDSTVEQKGIRLLKGQ